MYVIIFRPAKKDAHCFYEEKMGYDNKSYVFKLNIGEKYSNFINKVHHFYLRTQSCYN